MKGEINMLEIISAACDKHGVCFSGKESNAIMDAMLVYAKIYLQEWKNFNEQDEIH